MEITQITVYRVELPFGGGTYRLSGGRSWEGLDSSVIRVDTDAGIVGWGETCPLGPNYLEAFARGARAGIGELAPLLLGQNPGQPAVIYAVMDDALRGHAFVKHGIDMACWDILGKLAKKPLYTLFGGLLSDVVMAIGSLPPEHGDLLEQCLQRHRANGCRQFSVKASGDVAADIEYLSILGESILPGESVKVDANGGWRVDQARRVMAAIPHLDAYFEEPCASYAETRSLRRGCNRPIGLDESALDLETVVRARGDGICDFVNLKIGRVGGLTRALPMRDLLSTLGVPFYVQCTGGTEIAQAAVVHLAHATAPERLLYVWDIADLTGIVGFSHPLPRRDGRLHAHDIPGLGIEPSAEVLGEPVAVYN